MTQQSPADMTPEQRLRQTEILLNTAARRINENTELVQRNSESIARHDEQILQLNLRIAELASMFSELAAIVRRNQEQQLNWLKGDRVPLWSLRQINHRSRRCVGC